MPDQSLTSLYPPFAKQLEFFLQEAKRILNAYLFESFRPFETQLEYYKKGRRYDVKTGLWTITDPKLIVTKAQPGYSWHGYGTAIDVAFDGNTQKQGIQWTWDDKLPWQKLGNLGMNCGLEWAGEWKSFPEQPHFQNTYGLKINNVYDLYMNGGLEAVWKEFDKHQPKV